MLTSLIVSSLTFRAPSSASMKQQRTQSCRRSSFRRLGVAGNATSLVPEPIYLPGIWSRVTVEFWTP